MLLSSIFLILGTTSGFLAAVADGFELCSADIFGLPSRATLFLGGSKGSAKMRQEPG